MWLMFTVNLLLQADSGLTSGTARRTSGRTGSKGRAGASQGAPPALSTRSRKSAAAADLSKVTQPHSKPDTVSICLAATTAIVLAAPPWETSCELGGML